VLSLLQVKPVPLARQAVFRWTPRGGCNSQEANQKVFFFLLAHRPPPPQPLDSPPNFQISPAFQSSQDFEKKKKCCLTSNFLQKKFFLTSQDSGQFFWVLFEEKMAKEDYVNRNLILIILIFISNPILLMIFQNIFHFLLCYICGAGVCEGKHPHNNSDRFF